MLNLPLQVNLPDGGDELWFVDRQNGKSSHIYPRMALRSNLRCVRADHVSKSGTTVAY
jgi:hypothetical protein